MLINHVMLNKTYFHSIIIGKKACCECQYHVKVFAYKHILIIILQHAITCEGRQHNAVYILSTGNNIKEITKSNFSNTNS